MRFPAWKPACVACVSVALLWLMCGVSAALPGETAPSGFVPTAEVELAYYVMGTDRGWPPIVAVNGGPGLTHAYMVQNDLWERVARQRRVVFYDQRGDGRSTRLARDAPQTLAAQVADLEALRVSLRADRVDLVGDSFGGLIVLSYALAHPEHVRRLVVSDGLPGWNAVVHPMPEIFPDVDAEEEAHLKAMPKGKEADDYELRMHMRKCFYSPELAEHYLQGFKEMGFNAAVSAAVNAASQNVDLGPQLHSITAETLILTGRFDVNVAPLTAWRMRAAIPGAQMHIFEHSGHLPSYEEPEAYLQQLTAFLNR